MVISMVDVLYNACEKWMIPDAFAQISLIPFISPFSLCPLQDTGGQRSLRLYSSVHWCGKKIGF